MCAALLEELKLKVQGGEDGLTEASAAGNHGDPSSDFILVIEGNTLDWALQEELKSDFLELSCRCKAVICCRSTPLQKSQVVRLIRDQLAVMTLAVGKPSVCRETAWMFYTFDFLKLNFRSKPELHCIEAAVIVRQKVKYFLYGWEK